LPKKTKIAIRRIRIKFDRKEKTIEDEFVKNDNLKNDHRQNKLQQKE
jgi:hypothetical protein